MSIEIPRPIDPSVHPLATGNYRIATPAIQELYDLVYRCLRYRITGALIYGPSRIGKTRAIEYVRLLFARNYPKVTTYHAQCEHKPRHAEGPFFSNLLAAVGYPEPDTGGNPSKRMRLTAKIRDAAARAGSGVVLLFCDEAQRLNENEYEWLRDVHDALDRQQIKLLPGHLVAHQVNANVDPYEGVLPRLHFVDIPRLSQMVAISPRVIRRSLLAGSEHRQCCSSFKYCRLCSGLGYHCVLFQRPNESICPVHKIPLGMACRTCGLESPYVINASVLEMPFRCPACRSRYGSSFSISNLRPMRREGRIAIHRRCIARAVA
jgi:hypothetical protein